MIDRQRYELEKSVFVQEKFPDNAYIFMNIGEQAPCLKIAAKTNSGKIYTLHVDLREFPENIPAVYITKMLKDYNGNDMDHASATNHTLTSENGWTRLCHYGQSWKPNVSLFKVYIKCRVWLEAYEAHLSTGKPMNYYLKEDIG